MAAEGGVTWKEIRKTAIGLAGADSEQRVLLLQGVKVSGRYFAILHATAAPDELLEQAWRVQAVVDALAIAREVAPELE